MRWSRVVWAACGVLLCAGIRSPAEATPFADITASIETHVQAMAGAALPGGLVFGCDGVAAISCDTSLTGSYRGNGRYSLDQSIFRTITIRNASAVSLPLDTMGLFTDVTSYAHSSAGIGVDNGVTQSASFSSGVYLWFSDLAPGLLDEHSCSTSASRLACPGFVGDDNAHTFPLAALAPGETFTVRTGVRLMVAVDAPEPASVAVLGPILLAGALVRRRAVRFGEIALRRSRPYRLFLTKAPGGCAASLRR